MPGKTIKIFLEDGTPQGLRIIEVGLSTVHGISARRAMLSQLAKRPEVRKTGVYLLLGPNAAEGQQIYVGESSSVIRRVQQHDSGKDWWETIVLFTSKDLNLTTAHARWLEAMLWQAITDSNRFRLDNANQPPGNELPEADTADMHEFLAQVRLILGTMGVDLSNPVRSVAVQESVQERGIPAQLGPEKPTFHYSGRKFDATILLLDGAIVLRQGSKVAGATGSSVQDSTVRLREKLMAQGMLKREDESSLELTQDYEFDSLSATSSFVAGYPCSGPRVWKTAAGQTYAQWEASQATED